MVQKKISVIIPARNEAECLPAVLAELPKDIIHEIIVVDGHSSDGTADVVRKLGYKCVPQVGMGYGMAVETGLKHVSGDYVTFLDADGSYDPAALPILSALLDKGNDVAFCSRYLPESGSDDDTWIRSLGNWGFTLMMRVLFGVRLTDSLFLYMMAKRDVFGQFEMESKYFEWCIEFPIRVHRAKMKYAEIPSRERPRIAGESKVNAFIDGLKILWILFKLKISLKKNVARGVTAPTI
ncbi:MAG: glycosyltransferase family 2 protein [Pseudobdellovibrionaceae bacterium]